MEQLINDVDSSNTVDGEPIYYWINKHDVEVPPDAGYVALINCTRIIVRNLKLTKNDGMTIAYTSDSLVTNNSFTGNIVGIGLLNSSNNKLEKNYVAQNLAGSIGLMMSSGNTIIGNNISCNGGIHEHVCFPGYIVMLFSNNNTLHDNDVSNNWGGIYLSISDNNRIYHNNFINNSYSIYPQAKCENSKDIWDDGYPSGGNYWSDYLGVDTDKDGLGDTPYVIDANNTDKYPLMAPFGTFNVGVWNGVSYGVDVVSNSSVSNMLINIDEKTVSFNVTGVEGTVGFCRVTIPNVIVQELWQGNYTVLLNGEPWSFKNWTDLVNTYIYINYTHSEHEIVIIPEFPSITTLQFLMLTTLITTILLKKKRKTKTQTP
jgi:parallel beta-helix repeat protein